MRIINKLLWTAVWMAGLLLVGELYLAVMGKYIDNKPMVQGVFTAEENAFRKINGWANRAENEYKNDEDENVIMRIWPNGMRECRPDPDKRTDFNVAFVGCSCTVGEGVKAEDTMIWLLNERYPQVTFDNWGVCGYGAVQIYARAKQILTNGRKKYDLVVYNMLDDHAFRTYRPRILGEVRYNGVYTLVPYGNYDIFGRYRFHFVPEFRWPGEDSLLTVDLLKRVYCSYIARRYQSKYDRTVCSPEDYSNGVDCFFEVMDRVQELCREHGADFLICDIQPKGINRRTIDDPRFRYECINIDHPDSVNVKYHVKNIITNHPNGVVHAYWADRFAEWFDRRYADRLRSGR